MHRNHESLKLFDFFLLFDGEIIVYAWQCKATFSINKDLHASGASSVVFHFAQFAYTY